MSLYTRAAGAGSAAASNEIVKPALPQSVGYIVVVLIGFIIAFSQFSPFDTQSMLTFVAVMMFVTRILKRTVGEDNERTEM